VQPIVYIDTSTVRSGKLEEVKAGVGRLAEFVEANMPRIASYGFCFDDDRNLMTVVAVHPDSASLEFHLDTGGEEFRKFSELLDLKRIDVYGPVGDSVLDRLEQKARMLGSGVVAVHEYHAGFAR
jgi:hypothetical protein